MELLLQISYSQLATACSSNKSYYTHYIVSTINYRLCCVRFLRLQQCICYLSYSYSVTHSTLSDSIELYKHYIDGAIYSNKLIEMDSNLCDLLSKPHSSQATPLQIFIELREIFLRSSEILKIAPIYLVQFM